MREIYELPPLLSGTAQQQAEQLREYLLRLVLQHNSTEDSAAVLKGEKGDRGERGPRGEDASYEKIYPVGSVYISVIDAEPAALFGGTWERIKGRFLLAADEAYAPGSTGGEAEHTLSVDELPKHTHNIRLTSGAVQSGSSYSRISSTGSMNTGLLSDTGGSQPHNNMPPYLAVYMWKRTA